MAYFIILCPDRDDAIDARLSHRQEHLDYWNAKADVVKVAGAMLDGDKPVGSSFLIEAHDEDAAHALIAGDPFTRHGVFAGRVEVISVRPAIGAWLPPA